MVNLPLDEVERTDLVGLKVSAQRLRRREMSDAQFIGQSQHWVTSAERHRRRCSTVLRKREDQQNVHAWSVPVSVPPRGEGCFFNSVTRRSHFVRGIGDAQHMDAAADGMMLTCSRIMRG